MVTCSEGHPNPQNWEFCGECGAPLEDDLSTDRWYRTKWAIIGASTLAVLVISGAAVALAVTKGGEQTGSSAPTSADTMAIQEWWSGAHQLFTELEQSLNDSRRALIRADSSGLEPACQQMHDTAGVELQAHIPTPDPELTSELRAAAEDAHAAARMCLSVMAGSINNYHGEFPADLDQAEKHLMAAHEIVNEALTGAH